MPPGANSRFLYTTARKQVSNAAVFLSPRVLYRYVLLDDNRAHIVSEGDSLHRLAAAYFSSLSALPSLSAAGLWWVIADFQPTPIHDPTIRLVPGQRLVIPAVRTVVDKILRRPSEF